MSPFQNEPWLPQILVCPATPDPTAMLVNLLEKRPDLVTDEMLSGLNTLLALLSIDEVYQRRRTDFDHSVKDMFGYLPRSHVSKIHIPCLISEQAKKDLDDACEFIFLLNDVRKKIRRPLPLLKSVQAFLASAATSEAAAARTMLTIEGLKKWMEDRYTTHKTPTK